LKFNPIIHPPIWKMEGYPEYIANQKDLKSKGYNLENSIKKLKEFEEAGKYWSKPNLDNLTPWYIIKGE
jgi:hypothetical protein